MLPGRCPSSSFTALLACSLLGASAAHADSARLRWLGPARAERSDANERARLNAKCESCHREEAREWRGSLHRQAFVDPLFQSAYALEPLGFCRGCHAPEADPARAPALELAALGVACTTCHVETGNVVVASRASGDAPHPVRVDPALSTRRACAQCHEFAFPSRPSAAMQSTLSEHAGSTFSARECQSCHMTFDPSRRARRHDFNVLGNPAMIKGAVSVSATRLNEHAIELTLQPREIGHAFPTGDLFRRLELRACVNREGDEVCAPPIHLGRDYRVELTPQGTQRIPIGDSRVPAPGSAPPRRMRLPFEFDVSQLVVTWSVVYQRADDAMAKVLGLQPRADEMLIAAGQL